MDWSAHYPEFAENAATAQSSTPPKMKKDVEIVDIGCGFGGLLVALAPLMPQTLMLGQSQNRAPWSNLHHTDTPQASRFEAMWHNSSRSGYGH